MNPRIKELVGQAKFMAEETINKQISKNAELDAFAEKFAELIVRECASILRESAEHQQVTGSHSEAYILRAHATGLKKHFGVEP